MNETLEKKMGDSWMNFQWSQFDRPYQVSGFILTKIELSLRIEHDDDWVSNYAQLKERSNNIWGVIKWVKYQ